jgi:hypothetical protein
MTTSDCLPLLPLLLLVVGAEDGAEYEGLGENMVV